MFWSSPLSGFLPTFETSECSREVPDVSCSSVADGSRQTGCPFLLRNGAGTLRIATDSRFSPTDSFIDVDCTRGLSSSSSESALQSERTRGWSSSSSSSSRVRAGHATFFAAIKKKFHVSSGKLLLTQFWLIRKTHQITHSMSHCVIFHWSRVQAKNRTCNFVFFRIKFNRCTHILHLWQGE